MVLVAILYVLFCITAILWVVLAYAIRLTWGSIWHQRECEWRCVGGKS
nr:MAG TPA: hypothetical protein [Caudoviricetes sp.]